MNFQFVLFLNACVGSTRGYLLTSNHRGLFFRDFGIYMIKHLIIVSLKKCQNLLIIVLMLNKSMIYYNSMIYYKGKMGNPI